MPSRKSYNRFFIILQEDQKGYGLDSNRTPSGYAKLEMRNDRAKTSFYVQDIKKQNGPYYMVLIAQGNGGNRELINLGQINIDEGGKADISNEHDVNNIASTNIGMDKIQGAGICRISGTKVNPVMAGFICGEELNNWPAYPMARSNVRSGKPSENKSKLDEVIVKNEIKKETRKEVIEEMAKPRKEIAKPSEEVIKQKEVKPVETKKVEEVEIKKVEEVMKPREEIAKLSEEGAKLREEVIEPSEELVRSDEEVIKLSEELAKPKEEIIKPSEEIAKLDEEVVKLREELERLRADIAKPKEEVVDPSEVNKADHIKAQAEDLRSCNNEEIDEETIVKYVIDVEENNESTNYVINERDNNEAETQDFDEYEDQIERLKEYRKKHSKKNCYDDDDDDKKKHHKNDDHDKKCHKNDDHDHHDKKCYKNDYEEKKKAKKCDKGDYPVGPMGDFFKSVVKGLEKIGAKDSIKNCFWYKAHVENLEAMYCVYDYNKYSVVFYPMICYYPYISKAKNFMVGYKCNDDGVLKYIIYAIPGTKALVDQPYEGKTGFVTFMSETEDSEMGHWLMYYDIKKNSVVVPVKTNK